MNACDFDVFFWESKGMDGRREFEFVWDRAGAMTEIQARKGTLPNVYEFIHLFCFSFFYIVYVAIVDVVVVFVVVVFEMLAIK